MRSESGLNTRALASHHVTKKYSMTPEASFSKKREVKYKGLLNPLKPKSGCVQRTVKIIESFFSTGAHFVT